MAKVEITMYDVSLQGSSRHTRQSSLIEHGHDCTSVLGLDKTVRYDAIDNAECTPMCPYALVTNPFIGATSGYGRGSTRSPNTCEGLDRIHGGAVVIMERCLMVIYLQRRLLYCVYRCEHMANKRYLPE